MTTVPLFWLQFVIVGTVDSKVGKITSKVMFEVAKEQFPGVVALLHPKAVYEIDLLSKNALPPLKSVTLKVTCNCVGLPWIDIVSLAFNSITPASYCTPFTFMLGSKESFI